MIGADAEYRPEQCRGGDDEGGHSGTVQGDGVFHGEGLPPENGPEHPAPLPENDRGTHAGKPEEQRQRGSVRLLPDLIIKL